MPIFTLDAVSINVWSICLPCGLRCSLKSWASSAPLSNNKSIINRLSRQPLFSCARWQPFRFRPTLSQARAAHAWPEYLVCLSTMNSSTFWHATCKQNVMQGFINITVRELLHRCSSWRCSLHEHRSLRSYLKRVKHKKIVILSFLLSLLYPFYQVGGGSCLTKKAFVELWASGRSYDHLHSKRPHLV